MITHYNFPHRLIIGEAFLNSSPPPLHPHCCNGERSSGRQDASALPLVPLSLFPLCLSPLCLCFFHLPIDLPCLCLLATLPPIPPAPPAASPLSPFPIIFLPTPPNLTLCCNSAPLEHLAPASQHGPSSAQPRRNGSSSQPGRFRAGGSGATAEGKEGVASLMKGSRKWGGHSVEESRRCRHRGKGWGAPHSLPRAPPG